MQQYARVLRCLPANRAELLVLRSGACGHSCDGCGGCGTQQRLTVIAENEIGAAAGERVLLQSDSKTVLSLAMAVYLLPLALFFAGYGLGMALGFSAALLGAAGFALGIGATLLLERRIRRRRGVRYTVVQRIGETACSVTSDR